MQYDGSLYAPIGDFMRAAYLEYPFAQGTAQEVDFLLDLMQLPAGARVLDIGCGPGRHSLELARRGLRPLGIDISTGFIEVARRHAAAEALPAEFMVADARDVTLPPDFAAGICLCEGAFGLAGDEEGHRRVLMNVARALMPGAPFVLTAINALSVARRVEDEPQLGSIHTTKRFDPYTCTSLQDVVIHSPEGDTRSVEIYSTAFTYRELTWLLEGAAFHVEAGYGCAAGDYRRTLLTVQDAEIMMVARRA